MKNLNKQQMGKINKVMQINETKNLFMVKTQRKQLFFISKLHRKDFKVERLYQRAQKNKMNKFVPFSIGGC